MALLKKYRGFRWWMIGLLMLGSVVNYLTRATLAVAAPTVLADLHINEQQYSWILTTFQGAIMLQPIGGYVLDVLGLKIGFAIFAIAWSIISMAHGLADSWQVLAVLRGFLGFAEGTANPAGMKATSEWFPAKERGLAGATRRSSSVCLCSIWWARWSSGRWSGTIRRGRRPPARERPTRPTRLGLLCRPIGTPMTDPT